MIQSNLGLGFLGLGIVGVSILRGPLLNAAWEVSLTRWLTAPPHIA